MFTTNKMINGIDPKTPPIQNDFFVKKLNFRVIRRKTRYTIPTIPKSYLNNTEIDKSSIDKTKCFVSIFSSNLKK